MNTNSLRSSSSTLKQLRYMTISVSVSRHRFSSSHRAPRIDQLQKVSRLQDITGAGRGKSRGCGDRTIENHIRLIQGLFQSDSSSSNQEHSGSNLVSSRSEAHADDVFNEMFAYFDSCCSSFNPRHLSDAISDCASSRDIRGGVQHHRVAISTGIVSDAYVGSSLISLYSKCGDMVNARKVFDETPTRNVVSWTALISGFAQQWRVDVCFEFYSTMRSAIVEPNEVTFTSLLGACAGSGSLGKGRSIHCHVIQLSFDSCLLVANALITMYCKSGSSQNAQLIFDNMNDRDIVSWNSMIVGHAQCGSAMRAFELFEKMNSGGAVKPDAITYLCVLSSCRHMGFVGGGRRYLALMAEGGIDPELDHYSCIVDLLGRAGLLQEARNLIQKMPVSPNSIIWGSLLSSSRLHGDVWMGIEAAENKLLLEPHCAATHVQLANLYASVRWWDQVARVRKLMKDGAIKTSPGYSWIEINNQTLGFRPEGQPLSSSGAGEVASVLNSLLDHMLTSGEVVEVRMDHALS